MRIAFYAPMKPPTHPVPSGDRLMARSLMAALRRGGHSVFLASALRTWDAGDPARQRRLAARAEKTAARLAARWKAPGARRVPDLWFTYHLYHKAPDWLGPPVSRALGIPYAVAEASYAAKQANGPWAEGLEASRHALARADAVFALSEVDAAGLSGHVAPGRVHRLAPFIDAGPFAAAGRCRAGDSANATGGATPPRLLAVAMMRAGDKLASYRILGRALALLESRPWTLEVIGAGPAEAAVRAVLPAGRTRYRGALGPTEIARRIAAADMFVWPAINEAYGLALLEAQAGGLPVVAGASGGVPEIVRDGRTGLLVPPGDAKAFANALASLLDDPRRRARMGREAARNVLENHDIAAAADRLNRVIGPLAPKSR